MALMEMLLMLSVMTSDIVITDDRGLHSHLVLSFHYLILTAVVEVLRL
jgi:hypothetical protein